MFTGLLPIGSVVLLKEGEKRVMIIGFCQKQISEESKDVIWDYTGCIYPEGYMSADQTFLFNNDQIDKIFAVGYQDEEQFAFKVKVDAVIADLRKNESKDSE